MAGTSRAVALITGGSRGIGAAIVERLVHRGIDCINLDRDPPSLPSNARHVFVDLVDATQTAGVLEDIVASYDVLWLVNNAGIVAPAHIEDVRIADFDRVVAVNLRAVIQATQAVLPAMRRAGFGRIVNISSRAALGKELRSTYSATKAGLIGLTRTLALELGPDGITVNVVAPGLIETELFRAVNPADSPRTHALRDAIPMRRLGRPEDIAHAVDFFISDEASFITGQTLFVCGGLSVGPASPKP
jgi:NAD(P)-dependent dehydrogenase (short-subunit alcohol dehydrogenase family)